MKKWNTASNRAPQRGLKEKANGFTLIELMIVVAIIAIIAAIAYPSYINSVTKTNRAAAEGCLSEYANYMERYYTANMSYKNAPSPTSTIGRQDCASAQLTGRNYTYSFPSNPTTSAYTISAVPIGTQLSRDTQCGTLTLNQQGTRTASGTAPTTCW